MKKTCLAFLSAVLFVSLAWGQKEISWKKIDTGLYFTEISAPQKSLFGSSKYSVLKIDPKYFDFTLLSASQHGKKRRTARQWAEEFGCIATINAGLYQKNGLSNVGYMKNFKHVNNGYMRKDYKSILAFNPVKKTDPQIQILDRNKQNFNSFKKRYNTLIQNIRMISANQKNVWQQQKKRWSIAAIATDKAGNVLFIHSRSPYTVHDFNKFLLNSSLNIYSAMYVEGGPEASLYISDNNIKIKKMGSYESGFTEHNKNAIFWPIPNVIGIHKKK